MPDDGIQLKAEIRRTFYTLKVLSKVVGGCRSTDLFTCICLTPAYQSLWFSVGSASDYVYDKTE